MSLRTVLIVTYYWPPSGGSGVQRWLKFSKYLERAGWQVLVLTPENTAFTLRDPSLEKDVPGQIDVLRLPIWEPYDAFFKLSRLFGGGKPAASDMITTGKKSLFQTASGWIRGNFFIPDPKVFWVKPAVTFLDDLLRTNQISAVITTGPPHSIHLIGLGLKKRRPTLRWVADFRDPWSEWDLLDTLSMSPLARRRHRNLERKVLTGADKVITIAPYHVGRLEELSGRKVELITNGFDEEDFAGIQRARTTKFTMRHTGIVDELRDPRPMMEAIRMACADDPELRENIVVEFIGNVNAKFRSDIANDPVLGPVTRFVPGVPHRELLQLYAQTDLQLLILAHSAIAPGNLPGKFFEYLASGSPILAMGPVDGDAGAVLRQTNAGEIFERSDLAGMKASLLRYFSRWKSREAAGARDVSAFTRKRLTDQLISLLESLQE